MWDRAYMPANAKTELQTVLIDAVARSGRARDHFDSLLRVKLSTKGKWLYDIERGKVKRPSPSVLRAIEEVLGFEPEYLVELVHPRQQREVVVRPDQQPSRSIDAGETATVMRLDLSYAMGPGTNLDEDYVEGEGVELDISFLRRLTPSQPGMLRIVNGIGDSMQPTIHDSEELILDLAQRTLNLQDRIWAMSLYGVGAVKRLKAIGKGRVLVISDNPDVPDQEVDAEDLSLVGRVVGSFRRH